MKEKFFHLRARVFTRSKGHKMIAKAAYRAGEKIYDEKYHRLRNYEGKKKSEEIESAMYLPSHVSEKFKDRNFLYNEIERREGNVSNRQLARELEFSLYTDFTPQENKEMVERFAETFTKDGMIVDACFHKLNDKNPHCHMMLTLRDVNEDGITFGNKNRSWNSDKMHGKWRDTWEKIVNEKFKEKGLDIFVSRKSFEERGIDKKPTKHLPYDKKSAKYQEVLKENKKIKKQNEFKQKKKEIKQEVEQVKEVKQIVRNTKIAGITNNRKEVLGMGLEQEQLKQKPVYEEPGQDPNVYEEPEQSRTVGDLFTESINGLKERYERLNEDTKVLKADKKRSYERYRNHKETDYSKKMSLKKEDVIDMKLDYKMMKVNLKETSVFSLSDWKRRKQLKAAMKKKKIQIKKKKLEMKREKKKLKLYKKEHVKSRNKLLKNYKDKAKTFLLIKKTEREMNKVKNLNKQIDNNKVVSLKDFKKQKMKLELKPQFGKQRDKKLEL